MRRTVITLILGATIGYGTFKYIDPWLTGIPKSVAKADSETPLTCPQFRKLVRKMHAIQDRINVKVKAKKS